MEQQQKQKGIYFIATLILSGLLLWLCNAVPLASILFSFMIAASFTVMYLRCGMVLAGVGTLVMTGLYVLISFLSFGTTDITGALLSAAVLCLTGIAIGVCVRKRTGLVTMIIVAGGGFLISYGAQLLVQYFGTGVNPVAALLAEMQPVMQTSLEQTMTQTGMQDASEAAVLVRTLIDTILKMFPAILIIDAACTGYLLVFVSWLFLKLSKSEEQIPFGFSALKADGLTVLLFFLVLIGSFFLPEGILGTVLYNIYIILMFVLQICGLSIIDYFMKHRLHLPLIVRLLLVGVLFVLQMVPLFAAVSLILAVVDSRRDFRSLKTADKQD